MITGLRRALVIVAHPDDEVLGCGGSIARFASEGVDIQILFLADGVGSRANGLNLKLESDRLLERRAAAYEAARILGVNKITFGNFPDNRMDSVDLIDIVNFVENVINTHRPDTVFTHHGGDLNIDHRLVHQAVVTACRPVPSNCVNTLLFFEVQSSTEWQVATPSLAFLPNCFIDVSSHLVMRRKALEAYDEEMRPWPHSRSYEALEYLARWRGATIGIEAAEAFMLGRHQVRV